MALKPFQRADLKLCLDGRHRTFDSARVGRSVARATMLHDDGTAIGSETQKDGHPCCGVIFVRECTVAVSRRSLDFYWDPSCPSPRS
jgi:hypothetical protein